MRKFSSLVLCFGLIFGVVAPTMASASSVDISQRPVLEFGTVVTNENGEALNYEIKDVKRTSTTQKSLDGSFRTQDNSSSEGPITETYEVTVQIPTSEISPFESGGSSKEENEVKASISVTYDWRYASNNKDKEIKITNFSGSWVPQNSFLILSNRTASINNGVSFPSKIINQNPTSNSYSYNTGWDYVFWYPNSDAAGPRSNSEATITVAGMGGTAKIFCFVAISKF